MKYRFSAPLEEPRSKSYMKSYHVCYSRKLGRNITALGQFQFDNLLCLEMDPKVIWYCERPMEDILHINGKSIKVEPSVYVVYSGGQESFQLVTSGDTDNSVIADFNLWGVCKNEQIEIRRTRDIYAGVFFMRNIYFLAARARRVRTIDKGADDAFVRYLSMNGTMTIGQLITSGRLTEPNGCDYIADLYYRGLIRIHDMEEKQISYKTEVDCV
ncbi:hypothetical protein [Butyrivibrio sp. JL13D10]|uniref:hypothetical protein n=1 Tax=Butyrivibrio sp. JL13D10 TaxID=3236815 RepID=UPI0038B5A416